NFGGLHGDHTLIGLIYAVRDNSAQNRNGTHTDTNFLPRPHGSLFGRSRRGPPRAALQCANVVPKFTYAPAGRIVSARRPCLFENGWTTCLPASPSGQALGACQGKALLLDPAASPTYILGVSPLKINGFVNAAEGMPARPRRNLWIRRFALGA